MKVLRHKPTGTWFSYWDEGGSYSISDIPHLWSDSTTIESLFPYAQDKIFFFEKTGLLVKDCELITVAIIPLQCSFRDYVKPWFDHLSINI